MNVISYDVLSSTTRTPSDLFFPTHIWRIGDPPFRVYIAHGWASVRLRDSVRVYTSWDELSTRHGIRCEESDLQESDYPPDETEIAELVERFRRSGDEPTGDIIARAAGLPYQNIDLLIEEIVGVSGRYEVDDVPRAARAWARAFQRDIYFRDWLSVGIDNADDALFLHNAGVDPSGVVSVIPDNGVPPISGRSVAWHLSAGTISPLEAVGWAATLRGRRDDVLAQTLRWLALDESRPISWDDISDIVAARSCVTSLGRVAGIIGEMVAGAATRQ